MKSSSVAKVKKALTWEWRNEKIENMLHGEVDGSVLTANRLLDQKLVTNDTSDYLWLFTG